MPELPEVQTVVNDLQKLIPGKEISTIEEFYPNTIRLTCDENYYCSKVTSVSRRGKYILINLENSYLIIVHLRMTGKLIYEEINQEPLKHERARIIFTDNSFLRFDDVRTFGTIDCLNKKDIQDYFKNLGIEPLSDDFSVKYLSKIITKISSPVKTFLLDQRRIAGLGNIYVCEVLYRTGIHPLLPTSKLDEIQIKKLIKEIKLVLRQAIDCNGTTISDYRRVDDKTGSFQNFLQVYGKNKCPLGHDVHRIIIAGRSTFYCDKCQKM